ncbi:uncharacterized protein [Diadema setosum]|uniref:uncharacterized protein n=1 Tax=Diadema setosum TaxID=31175 RepID=UPI003B3B59C7
MSYFKHLFGIFSGAIVFWFLFVKRANSTGRLIRRRALQPDSTEYNCKKASFPLRSSGLLLRFLRHMTSTWVGTLLLKPHAARNVNMRLLRSLILDDAPTFYPSISNDEPPAATNALEVQLDQFIEPERASPAADEFRFNTISDYYHAFRSGKVTPEDVAESVMEALERSNQMKPRMRMVTQYDLEEVYKMARASTVRINNKKPLSIFDGIPVVIKESLAVVPYKHKNGTSFLGRDEEKEDSAIAAKLRAGGAVIIGVANMHELGLGTLGINVSSSGTARNPYNPHHYAGGSSSGSGACVASGLCPIAIGTDGGGSIRIPSALCGIVGIKPTHGRVSAAGTLPLCHTVAVTGPMTTCVRDTALLLAFLSGQDPREPSSWSQPPLVLSDLGPKSLAGLKIGIDWTHFRHANPEVVAECDRGVSFLEQQGAELVGIQIPEFEEMRIAHALLISTEMLSLLQGAMRDNFYDLAADTTLILGMAATASAVDYINANKQRTRTIHFLKQIFKEVDVIVCPATGVTAPQILPGDLQVGVNDTGALLDIMRFAPLGNLSGIPGLAVPVGYDAKNLPIGLQIMGPWWEENRILRVGAVLERMLKKKHQPQVYFDILKEAMH